MANDINNPDENQPDPLQQMTLERDSLQKQLNEKSDQQSQLNNKVQSIYGSEADKLGENTGTYMNTLRNNLNKNVANADLYNSQAGQARGLANAKAGLSGTDTSAADEQSRRNSIYGAAGINEAAQRQANEQFGKATGNIASGINKIEQTATANSIANLAAPLPPESSSGILSDTFGWLV